ncbi:MAG: GNAT family N-acetyltransferase [Caldisericales bacterium]|nr:GNAT family N-acetyltransferase [Caldisericales bacterium]
MDIIKTHRITLFGKTDKYDIVLKPLNDEHLPLLYKWCADPEVLYWTEGGEDTDLSYDKETVHAIYGGVSQNAYCFLIEANGVPIGEGWLQKMNLPEILAMYPKTLDVRRIDMSIGEKDYWNQGIGSQFVRIMVEFAFASEHVDVLHCICGDYNKRSQHVFEKNGFTLMQMGKMLQPQEEQLECHYVLTAPEYFKQK